jgi:hypothetical protein
VVVDYERAWLRLKAIIDGKNSHGTRDLLREMAKIEVACEIPEAEQGFDARPRLRSASADDDARELCEQVSSASS